MDSYDSLKKTGSMFFQSWNYQAAPQKEFSKVWGLGERQTSQSPPPLTFFWMAFHILFRQTCHKSFYWHTAIAGKTSVAVLVYFWRSCFNRLPHCCQSCLLARQQKSPAHNGPSAKRSLFLTLCVCRAFFLRLVCNCLQSGDMLLALLHI